MKWQERWLMRFYWLLVAVCLSQIVDSLVERYKGCN
jgi:hypothetical protein